MANSVQAFVFLTTFFICLAQPFKQLLRIMIPSIKLSDRIIRIDSMASTNTSSTLHRSVPPSRNAELDSPKWDTETIKTYTKTVSGRKPPLQPSSEALSMPSPTTIGGLLQSHGRIKVDSEEDGGGDLQIFKTGVL